MPRRELALKTLDLEVVVSDDGMTRRVAPKGEIDLSSVGSVRAPLQSALSNGFERVVLDLADTEFIDSTGMHLVVELTARAEAEGARFVILPGPPAVQRLFALCGLEHYLSGAG